MSSSPAQCRVLLAAVLLRCLPAFLVAAPSAWGQAAVDERPRQPNPASPQPPDLESVDWERLPRKVYVSFSILGIHNIDSIKQTFDARFFLYLKWRDQSARNRTAGEVLDAPPDDFAPSIIFVNSSGFERQPSEPTYTVIAPGWVGTMGLYRASFSTPMNLRPFPHDSQTLQILIEDFDLDDSQLEFVYEDINVLSESGEPLPADGIRNKDDVLGFDYALIPKWNLKDISLSLNRNPYPFFQNLTFSQLAVNIDVDRRPAYFTYNIQLIVYSVTALGWIILFLDPRNLQWRFGIAIGILLLAFIHNSVIASLLPKIPYLTTLDYQLVLSKLLIVLVVAESLAVFLLTGGIDGETTPERRSIAKGLDKWSRWIFPALLLVVVAIGTRFTS